MARFNLGPAARELAGDLREVANYPAPDNVTLDRVNVVIKALEDGDGLAASTMSVNLAVDLLVAHWRRLLLAPDDLFSMSREAHPQLGSVIDRLLRSRELYIERRARLETF